MNKHFTEQNEQKPNRPQSNPGQPHNPQGNNPSKQHPWPGDKKK